MVQTTQIERSIIGTILIKPDLFFEAQNKLTPAMFFTEREAAAVLFEMMEEEGKVNMRIFASKVARLSGKDERDILTYKNDLDSLGFAGNVAFLLDAYIQDQEISIHQKALQKLIEGEEHSKVLLESQVERDELYGFQDDDEENRVKLYTGIADSIFRARDRDGLPGIDTGFKVINDITGGYMSTDQIVVAGRAGMGKTTFALNALYNVSKQGVPTLFISGEMSVEQIIKKLVSIESGISMEKIRSGNLTNEEFEAAIAGVEQIAEMPIFIKYSTDFETIKGFVRMHCRKYGVKVWCGDYLQLFTAPGRFSNRNLEIEHMSRGFKALSGPSDCNVTTILLAQVNRSVETRSDKRPTMSDLRDSGSIEQDADLVAFLYRPEYYNQEEDDEGNSLKGKVEFIIRKNRHGETKTLMLDCDLAKSKFSDEKREPEYTAVENNIIHKRGNPEALPF